MNIATAEQQLAALEQQQQVLARQNVELQQQLQALLAQQQRPQIASPVPDQTVEVLAEAARLIAETAGRMQEDRVQLRQVAQQVEALTASPANANGAGPAKDPSGESAPQPRGPAASFKISPPTFTGKPDEDVEEWHEDMLMAMDARGIREADLLIGLA